MSSAYARSNPILAMFLLWPALAAQEQVLPIVSGWEVRTPGEGQRVVLDLEAGAAHAGAGCARLSMTGNDPQRPYLSRTFPLTTRSQRGDGRLARGKTYRYALAYRTDAAGAGKLVIDCSRERGEGPPPANAGLASVALAASTAWRQVEGTITVPDDAAKVYVIIVQSAPGTLWVDGAFLGEAAAGAQNRFDNGGFEPPASARYDLAPEAGAGVVRLSGGFENATLGAVKEIAPDEFYVYGNAFEGKRSSFMWFHFRLDGCAGRTVTVHVNVAPFAKDRTGGNGTRSPVMSPDGLTWLGIADRSWNEDGTVLTFRQHFASSPAWVASFFPFPPARVEAIAAAYAGDPRLALSTIGRTPQGRDLRMLTVTDPTVPEADKREVLFTALQHDLETSGGMVVEGMLRFLMSDDPVAQAMRRALVVRAVPVMDPDGIAQGNLYCPVGNMNRQWGLGTTPETTAVEKLVQSLAARGRKLALHIDYHGWCAKTVSTEYIYCGKEVVDAPYEERCERLAGFIHGGGLPGPSKLSPKRALVTFVSYGQADIRTNADGWTRLLGGAETSMCIEPNGDGGTTQEEYLRWGRANAQGIARFLGIAPEDGHGH